MRALGNKNKCIVVSQLMFLISLAIFEIGDGYQATEHSGKYNNVVIRIYYYHKISTIIWSLNKNITFFIFYVSFFMLLIQENVLKIKTMSYVINIEKNQTFKINLTKLKHYDKRIGNRSRIEYKEKVMGK